MNNKNLNKKKSSNKPLIIAIISVTIVLIVEFIYLSYNSKNEAKLNSNKNNHFNDKILASCVLESYNKENNENYTNVNELTENQLASIKNLNCLYLSDALINDSLNYINPISDYRGIEKLTGIEEFSSYNSEKAINLDLSHNIKLTSLTILNENENSKTEITGIDNLSNLKILRTYNINMKKNYFSNLINLETLYLHNTDINFNGNFTNKNLKEITIENMNIEDINISNLNLTKLTLTIPSLNNLTLGNQPNLTEIKINDGILTNIDFSGCPNLENIVIPETVPCINIDYFPQVSRAYKTEYGYASVGDGSTTEYNNKIIDGRNLICEH